MSVPYSTTPPIPAHLLYECCLHPFLFCFVSTLSRKMFRTRSPHPYPPTSYMSVVFTLFYVSFDVEEEDGSFFEARIVPAFRLSTFSFLDASTRDAVLAYSLYQIIFRFDMN